MLSQCLLNSAYIVAPSILSHVGQALCMFGRWGWFYSGPRCVYALLLWAPVQTFVFNEWSKAWDGVIPHLCTTTSKLSLVSTGGTRVVTMILCVSSEPVWCACVCIQCFALRRSVIAAVKTQGCMYLQAPTPFHPQLGLPVVWDFCTQSHTGQSSHSGTRFQY